MAKRNYLVDIDLNKNELQNAVIHNYSVLPILTEADLADIGRIAYNTTNSTAYILNNVIGVATWEPLGNGSSSGVGGGIFVMGVSSNVVGENTTITASTENEDITQITATTKNLKFNLLALTGSKNLKPSITYTLGTGTTEYAISGFVKQENDRPVYLVSNYAINLGTANYITFKHEDGATKRLDIITESLPVINSVIFSPISGSDYYPTNQTELGEEDPIKLTIDYNSLTAQKIIKIEVYNEGACKPIVFNYSGINMLSSSGTVSIDVVAANRTPQTPGQTVSYGAVVSITKEGGATSTKYYTVNDGNTEALNVIKLNNTFPVISSTVPVGYPSGFTAIKGDTNATVGMTISNVNILGEYTVKFETVDGQLIIPSPGPTSYADANYPTSKAVTTSWAGYNIGTSNYTITVTKNSNQRASSKSTIVRIANIAPEINITLPASRLISAPGSGQLHTITATSNQSLNSLQLTAGSNGNTWANTNMFNISGNTATNTLAVKDIVAKGTYNFTNLTAINIAGFTTSTIKSGASYILGGFTQRSVTMEGSGRSASFSELAVTATGYGAGKCIVNWQTATNTLPQTSRYAAGTMGQQPESDAWCVSATQNNPATVEVRFLNSGAAISSESLVYIQENA